MNGKESPSRVTSLIYSTLKTTLAMSDLHSATPTLKPSYIDGKLVTLHPPPSFPQIILALAFQDTDPPTFHWMLFFPSPKQENDGANIADESKYHGHKVHVTVVQAPDAQPGEIAWKWVYECVPFTLVTSRSLAAAVIIGFIPSGSSFEDLEPHLAEIPLSVPPADAYHEPIFTCRVWIRQALRVLHAKRILWCYNIDLMEDEMREYGEAAHERLKSNNFGGVKLVLADNSGS